MIVRYTILAALAVLVFAGCASSPYEKTALPVQDMHVGSVSP